MNEGVEGITVNQALASFVSPFPEQRAADRPVVDIEQTVKRAPGDAQIMSGQSRRENDWFRSHLLTLRSSVRGFCIHP